MGINQLTSVSGSGSGSGSSSGSSWGSFGMADGENRLRSIVVRTRHEHTHTRTHPHTQNKGKYSFRICELLDLHCIPNVFHNSFRGAAPQQQISKQTKPNKIKQNSKNCFKIHRQCGRVEGEVTAKKKKDNNNNNNLIVIDGRNKR